MQVRIATLARILFSVHRLQPLDPCTYSVVGETMVTENKRESVIYFSIHGLIINWMAVKFFLSLCEPSSLYLSVHEEERNIL